MKKLIYLFIAMFAMCACTNGSTSKSVKSNDTVDTTMVDTTVVDSMIDTIVIE
mgnify:CR=1 FL=1